MNSTQQTLNKIIKFIDDYYKVSPIFYQDWFNKYGVNNLNYLEDISLEEENEDIENYLNHCLYMLEECERQYPKGSEIIGFQIADIMRMMAESKELNGL